MMRLPAFNLEMPSTVAEAAEILARDPGNTRIVAGGTDLWPNMKRRHQSAETVISMAKVPAMRTIEGDGTGEVRIGALVTLTEITDSTMLATKYPGFARAVGSISAPALRNTGTIGGNLCLDTRCTYYNQTEEWRQSIDCCLKERGEVCWVAPGSTRCWATSSTDAAPVLCALGAKVKLVSSTGERTIGLAEMYVDDGIAYMSKRRDEVLTELILPASADVRSTYWKLRRRGSIDFPVLGVGATVQVDDKNVVTACSIYLGAVRSSPTEAVDAQQSLIGKTFDAEAIAEAAKLARKPAAPLDNTDFVVAWRKTMVERYVDGALRELAGLEAKTKRPNHGTQVA
jgi:4-hydroxybenzoyl-CoA reductase subunit beta